MQKRPSFSPTSPAAPPRKTLILIRDDKTKRPTSWTFWSLQNHQKGSSSSKPTSSFLFFPLSLLSRPLFGPRSLHSPGHPTSPGYPGFFPRYFSILHRQSPYFTVYNDTKTYSPGEEGPQACLPSMHVLSLQAFTVFKHETVSELHQTWYS